MINTKSPQNKDKDHIWTVTTALRRELELGATHVAISEAVSEIVAILISRPGMSGGALSMKDYEPGVLEQLRDAQLANQASAEDILNEINVIKSALID